MAEEGISLPDSQHVTEKEGNDWRRNSTGKRNHLSSREKVLPGYLRASTGSCHNFCKYGKGHENGEKARLPIFKRTTAKLPADKIVITSLESPQRKRTSGVRVKPSHPKFGECASDATDVIKQEGRKLPRNSTDLTKREVSMRSSDGQNSLKNKTFSEKREKKPAPISKTQTSNAAKLREPTVLRSSKTVGVSSSARPSLKSKESILSTKRTRSLEPKSVAEKPSSFGRSAVQSSRRESNFETSKTRGTSKEMKAKRASLPFPNGSVNLNARKSSSSKVVPSSNSRSKVKAAEADKSKNASKQVADNISVKEKTLYVIKMETEDETLESNQNERCVIESSLPESSSSTPPSSSSKPASPSSLSHEKEDQGESECRVTETEDSSAEHQEKSEDTVTEAEDDEYLSECSEAESIKEAEASEGKSKQRQKKGSDFSSKDAESQMMELHFKRGKVIDVRCEDNTPRRLKFRRGRVVGENQVAKSVGRRSFKSRGADVTTDESKADSKKVVLKHQDQQQGKKDSQGLFNNVIEETANKLVETRKSKVKALVGAFETVISLQENKRSANTTA